MSWSFGQIDPNAKSESYLERLLHEDFLQSVGFVLPPAAFRRALQRHPDVIRLSTAVRLGQVSEMMIREFTARLSSQFQEGNLLPGDIAISSLAVALESIQTDFAEEFLCNLARLQMRELATPIRVAQICWSMRVSFPKTEVRAFDFPAPRFQTSHRFSIETNRVRQQRGMRVAEYAKTEPCHADT